MKCVSTPCSLSVPEAKPTRHQEILRKVALTSVVVLCSVVLFQALPALAAPVKAALKDAPRKSKKKGVSFFKKIIDGANTKGSFRNMKVGDTRSQFATLVNSFSALFSLLFMAALATVYTSFRDLRYTLRAKKEVQRINEYKENMYFEAVSELLGKLAESGLKGSTKASLTRQLKELDPDGRITRFLDLGGPRPDMSDIINKKPKKKGAKPVKKEKEVSRVEEPEEAPLVDEEPYLEVSE